MIPFRERSPILIMIKIADLRSLLADCARVLPVEASLLLQSGNRNNPVLGGERRSFRTAVESSCHFLVS